MNIASASVTVPTVTHAPVSTLGLAEKVSIRNLDFYYGASKALKSINIPLYENKVTAFIGPSGCGKSTLLRVLNRMYDLYPNQRAEGEVEFDGEDILSPKQDLNSVAVQKSASFPRQVRKRTSEPKPHWVNKVAGVLRIPKFARSAPHNDANFGIGTPAREGAARRLLCAPAVIENMACVAAAAPLESAPERIGRQGVGDGTCRETFRG